MKCLSCNNEIPEGSVICPVCGRPTSVQGGTTPSNPTPGVNPVTTNTSVLPTTPTEPVLPKDQKLEMTQPTPVVSSVNTVNANNPVQTPVNPVEGNNLNNGLGTVNPNVNTVVSQNSNVNPVNTSVEPAPTAPSASVAPAQMPTNTATPTENVAPQTDKSQLVNDINPEYIEPDGASVKLENTKPVDKKKNRKNIIIIAVVAVVLIIIAVLGILYYSTQYKSADKRIQVIVNALTKSTRSLNNDTIEKSSGNYNIDLNVSYADTNIGGKLTGTYATDLTSKALDLTVNLESLNIGEELIDSPINVELYYSDAKIYYLLQNFYENYIYEEFPEFEQIFDSIEQNNINYMTLINGVKTALGTGLKSMNKTQTVGNASIGGTSKKANIITIRLSNANLTTFSKSFLRSLLNNQNFIAEAAKLTEESEDTIKANLTNAIDEFKIEDTETNGTMEIYTAMFGEEFYGIKMNVEEEGKKDIMEIVPVTDGYTISYKEDSQEIFNITVTSTEKKTSTTKESTFVIDGTIYVEEQAYNLKLNVATVSDVNPKDAKVNVKNSINRKYLTEEDKQNILTKASQTGKIGLYLPAVLSLMLGSDETTTMTDPCTTAVNCVPSADGLTNTCQDATTLETITCPIN